SRWNEETGLAVDDQVAQSADCRRHHRPPVRHRLRADDAESFPARRADDDRGPPIPVEQLVVREEAEGAGDELTQTPGAGDDTRQAPGSLDQLEHALLLREPSG